MPATARLAACVLGLIAAVSPGFAQAADDPHILVLGRISNDPKAHHEQLKPLLDYVVPRMADVGIREGRVLMARDVQQMASYLRRGRVDWVTETAGTSILLQQRSKAQTLLVTERDGVSQYNTVFFARRDGAVASIDGMLGHSIAFQNPASTSAYFQPAAELVERGMPLDILLSPMERPDAESVGYLFARTELNISTWVHKRLVDVGVMSNLDWNNPQRVPASYKPDLKIIHESPAYPRALEIVRGDLDAKVQARLRDVLLAAADDPDAREALLLFFKTTRFLPVDATSRHALDDMRAGVIRVHTVVE